jgi:predicted Zn finger-like uncharacterized protein
MIVTCDRCSTKYNLDESLVKKGGSKVRCSRCRHVFVAYPPAKASTLGLDEGMVLNEQEFEETVTLDTPSFGEAIRTEEGDKEKGDVFSEFLDETLEEREPEMAEAAPDTAQAEEPRWQAQEAGLGETTAAAERKRAGKRSTGRRLLVAFLVALVIIAVGIGALLIWAPQYLPGSLSRFTSQAPEKALDTGVRQLTFKGVTGAFVDISNGRQLFVIRGLVSNDYATARSFILVRGSILNDKGETVRKQEAYAGNVFTDEALRSISPDDLTMAMKNRSGKDNADVNIPPAGTVPFMIAFENLPENLSEFTVEAVSSEPAS